MTINEHPHLQLKNRVVRRCSFFFMWLLQINAHQHCVVETATSAYGIRLKTMRWWTEAVRVRWSKVHGIYCEQLCGSYIEWLK